MKEKRFEKFKNNLKFQVLESLDSRFPGNVVHKDWAAKKVTIFNSIICLLKTSENGLFFTFILPQYLADEITKEFGKNSHFESMRADFHLRFQKSFR